MGGIRHKRKKTPPSCLETLPKENIILTQYIITARWLIFLDRIGHYIILPGKMDQLLVITINLNTPGYNYASRRLKKPTEILGIIQRLNHLLDPRGKHRTQRHHMAFSGTNTK